MEPRREDYRGHVIELRTPPRSIADGDETDAARVGDEEPELLIDGEVIGYGQLPDGSYALHDYAYDWTGDLVELARKFIDHESGTG